MLKTAQNLNRILCSGLFSTLFLSYLLAFCPASSRSAPGWFLENGNPTSRGTDGGTFIDTPTRLKIDLAGMWDFALDDGATGKVKIPSAFNGTGKVTFSRTLELTADQLDRYRFDLVMLGANYSCEVSINGEYVGNHIGGYTSFIQALPKDYLQAGKDNHLQIVVDATLDPRKTIPVRPQVLQQRNYGGILRDVFILATPLQHIREAIITADLSANGASATVHLRASLEGQFPRTVDTIALLPSRGGRSKPPAQPVPGFYFEAYDRTTGVAVATSKITTLVPKGNEWEDVQTSATIEIPKLWTPDTPDLYLIKCFLVMTSGNGVAIVDEYDLITGIRHLTIEDGNLILNGHRLIVKGVLWTEQHPSWGSSVPYEQMEKDVAMMKNLGANLVRFAEHPPHPYLLDLCDRYGLFAMEELPVVQVPSAILGTESFGDLAAAMMREMIIRDRNHPSVFAWGLGDEFEASKPESVRYVEMVASAARGLDHRPLYYGASVVGVDLCTKFMDLATVNVHGTDLKTFKTELENWRDAHSDKPVIVSKFGVEVQQDNRNGYSDPLSQESQARFFVQRLDALKALDYDGAIAWSYSDWLSDRPAMTVHAKDPWQCSNGLVSANREKRLAYEAVRSIYRGEKFLALPAGTYSPGAPIVYVLTGFVVLVGIAYLYNANRRFRESVNRSMFNTYNFFADVRDQRIVSLIQTSVLAVVVSIATSAVLSSLLYHFRDSLVFDNVLSMLLVSDRVKAGLVRLIWSPFQCIMVFTVLLFAKLVFVSLCVLAMRMFFRSRIFMFHAYAVTIWSTTPLLLFIPAGMILYRVMESPMYVIPSLIFVAALFLWVVLRFLRGVSIIVDVSSARMYALGVLGIVVVAGILYWYYDATAALPDHAAYMYHLVAGS